MAQVLPAIIPNTVEQMTEEMKKVSRFASLVQVDICDGVFTPNKTWPYNGRDVDFFEKLKAEEVGWPLWEDMDVELHLMVDKPEEVLEDWIYTGITAVVCQIETTEKFEEIIELCKTHSVALGIALKPSTDIERIAPFVNDVDFIQCMGSDLLGKHHTQLDDRVIPKIHTLREMFPERIISIDIGVTEETAEQLVSAGVQKLISGGTILDATDPEEEFNFLKSL